MTPPTNNERLAALEGRITGVVSLLETINKKLDVSEEKREQFRNEYERRHALLERTVETNRVRIEAMSPEIDANSEEIKQLTKLMQTLVEQVRNLVVDQETQRKQTTELVESNTKLQEQVRLLMWGLGAMATGVIGWMVTQVMGLIK